MLFRSMEVDWSDWNGKVEQPEHPLSRPLNKSIKTGADSAAHALATGDVPVLIDAPKQPTKEEEAEWLIKNGFAVPDDQVEILKKQDEIEWNSKFDCLRDWANHRLDEDKGVEFFAKGKSFNEQFLEDEIGRAHV